MPTASTDNGRLQLSLEEVTDDRVISLFEVVPPIISLDNNRYTICVAVCLEVSPSNY